MSNLGKLHGINAGNGSFVTEYRFELRKVSFRSAKQYTSQAEYDLVKKNHGNPWTSVPSTVRRHPPTPDQY